MNQIENNKIMESVAIHVKKALNESKQDVSRNFKKYLKDQLVSFFDCGDDEYAYECYKALCKNDQAMLSEVKSYLYDHDDDDYINRYMAEFDIDFPEEELDTYILKHYKSAYESFRF